MTTSKLAQSLRNHFVTGGLLCAMALSAACETTDEQQKPDPGPSEVVRAPEVDPHLMCQMRAAVDDAMDSGRTAEMAAELNKRRKQNPNDMSAHYGATKLIKKEKARWQAFRAIRETHPASAIPDLGECEVYAGWKMADQAKGPCERAAAASLGPIVEVARAELALGAGDTAGAMKLLDGALAADPGCVPALTAKAKAQQSAGDSAGALASWDAALAALPQCFGCARAKAELVEKDQGLEAALPHWEKALGLIPDNASVLQRYAAAQVGRDDTKALSAYEGAISAGIDDAQTLLAAASIADKLGQADKAIDYAEKAVAKKADDISTWRMLRRLFKAKGDNEGTDRAAREIIRLEPEDAAAHLEVARLALGRKDFADALLHFDAGIAQLEKSGADADALKAASGERKSLRKELMVLSKVPKGTAQKVVGTVSWRSRQVYEERLKKKRRLKGAVAIEVTTDKSGAVQEVNITSDDLKDPYVIGCLVGNLRRAQFSGGAQKMNFELSFEK